MTTLAPISIVANANGVIRNPANPCHYMSVEPVEQRVQVHLNGVLIADAPRALRLIEVGDHAYEPRLYISAAFVEAELTRTDKTTYCPLKGDAVYYAFDGTEVAWRYNPLPFANGLEGYLSFFGEGVTITEGATAFRH